MAKLKETADILVTTPEVVVPKTVKVEVVEVEVVVPEVGHTTRAFRS